MRMSKARIQATHMAVLFSLLTTISAIMAAETGMDPAHKYAWGENIGWANSQSANHNVTVHYDEASGGWLSGHLWAANIGWIVMGSAGGGPYGNSTAENWGVNLAADGKLTGYAWAENIGWIKFEQTHGQPAINPANGEFSGHAWGVNIGWVSFRGASPEYGVRTMAFDMQPKGTPNWWLAKHDVNEDYDAGDAVPAWRKFVMNTDPNVEGDFLRVTSISTANGETDVAFTPSSTRRYYTLIRREYLTDGDWNPVAAQIGIPGGGGEQTLADGEPATTMFYGVTVKVDP